MENKTDLLKKLGFSDELIEEIYNEPNKFRLEIAVNSDLETIEDSSDNNLIIESTGEPQDFTVTVS